MNASQNPASPKLRQRYFFAVVVLLWLGIFTIALTGFPNLMDNERRVGAYVLDAVQNGHWMMQRDATGDIAAKPPLLTWIAALATLPLGHLTRFAIYLPSALATLGVALTILFVGRARFGWLAGFFGALTYMLSPLADTQIVTARYDGLFAFPVTLAAFAAFRAWNLGRGWTWFWLAAAAATMVKGPLGVVLPAAGLLAAFWEKRSGEKMPIRGSHLAGIGLFLLITGGWFALAYHQMGQPLLDKLIGRELVGHLVKDGDRTVGGGFYEPTLNVITHFLPWSIFAAIAIWRVWKHPSPDKETRRFERFLFCWFFIGLIIFSCAAHQRGRLIFPLMPAVALLAGRELARRFGSVRPDKLFKVATVVAVFTLGIFFVYHHSLVKRGSHVKQTIGIKEMAASVQREVGAQFPLTHLDSPFAIQFYLNTVRTWVETEQAAELLRGDAAAFVVVRDFPSLETYLGTNAIYTLLRWPASGDAFVQIVSNHPRLEWTADMATIIGSFSLRMQGVKLIQSRGEEFVFESETKSTGKVTVTNVSETPKKVRVRFAGKDGSAQERMLSPGEIWQIQTGALAMYDGENSF